MDSAILWGLIVAGVVFLAVLGVEALLSAGADEDDWWKTREAWIQPLIAGGVAGAVVTLIWLALRGLFA